MCPPAIREKVTQGGRAEPVKIHDQLTEMIFINIHSELLV